MYPISNAFLTAVKESTRKYYWTGRITTKGGVVYEFNQNDMVKGSGYITSQCCESTEIELGTVYSVEMGISFFLTLTGIYWRMRLPRCPIICRWQAVLMKKFLLGSSRFPRRTEKQSAWRSNPMTTWCDSCLVFFLVLFQIVKSGRMW